ncbi:MAG: helix-turn-helix transcriptional regulator [Sedimentisphaerales bacterium]
MIIETIRKHIEMCGKTRYRICQESGVSEAQLCRIMKGKTCTVETADILLKYFGLTITGKNRSKKSRV